MGTDPGMQAVPLATIEVTGLLFLVLYFHLSHYCHSLKVEENALSPNIVLKIASLRYNLHTIQFTHFVYNSMAFSMFTELCIHPQDQF